MTSKTNRREFIKLSALSAIGAAATSSKLTAQHTQPPAIRGGHDMQISKITVHRMNGRRPTPIAPNAYAKFRGRDVHRDLLRIETNQGIVGYSEIGRSNRKLYPFLLGVNPRDLFEWTDGYATDYAMENRGLMRELRGFDIALLDIMGKADGKPVADLLGKRVRPSTPVYDSSLYMEDLLTPDQARDIAYHPAGLTDNPIDMLAHKTEWVLKQPRGTRILKIKIGRAKWMGDFDASVQRDIDAIATIRKAAGPNITLFVDGNNGYTKNPQAVKTFVDGVKDHNVFAMEEMLDHNNLKAHHDIKAHLRRSGSTMKLTDGENIGGLPEHILRERFTGPDGGTEPLFDVNQPDMIDHGYMRMREMAATAGVCGMQIAPHNFGFEFGVYAQIHQGLVTENWLFSESDDTNFDALDPVGIEFAKGQASLTGMPGLGVRVDESKLGKQLGKWEI